MELHNLDFYFTIVYNHDSLFNLLAHIELGAYFDFQDTTDVLCRVHVPINEIDYHEKNFSFKNTQLFLDSLKIVSSSFSVLS